MFLRGLYTLLSIAKMYNSLEKVLCDLITDIKNNAKRIMRYNIVILLRLILLYTLITSQRVVDTSTSEITISLRGSKPSSFTTTQVSIVVWHVNHYAEKREAQLVNSKMVALLLMYINAQLIYSRFFRQGFIYIDSINFLDLVRWIWCSYMVS